MAENAASRARLHLTEEGMRHTANTQADHRLGRLKLQAIKQLQMEPRIQLTGWVGDHPLYIEIHRKKLSQIQAARSGADLKAILAPPAVRRTPQGGVEPANEWVLPEEELIVWSNTSLLGPLDEAAMKRYKTVFLQVYPERADVFNEKS